MIHFEWGSFAFEKIFYIFVGMLIVSFSDIVVAIVHMIQDIYNKTKEGKE